MNRPQGDRNNTTESAYDHSADDRFVEYYRDKSTSGETEERSGAMFDTLRRVWGLRDKPFRGLDVADIGCGPGAQSIYWAGQGQRVHGLDVSRDFIEVARERAEAAGLEIDFRIGSATDLPWQDESMDVCLAPELLEHVPEWEDCLDEFARILRPGGLLYINTSNKLCPVQNEFTLPLYSWYPGRLKRYCEKLAVTSKPQIANFATYPAVNWFTTFGLNNEFQARGMTALDRMDLMHMKADDGIFRSLLDVVRRSKVLRFAVQLVTPYTIVVGVKS